MCVCNIIIIIIILIYYFKYFNFYGSYVNLCNFYRFVRFGGLLYFMLLSGHFCDRVERLISHA